MNIKRLLSIFVAFTILTQNAVFAYNINFENANNYSSEIEQISHYSLTEEKELLSDVIDNDVSFMSLENDHIETNHRKQINTIVDKYVMSPPGENEVRVIATYNTENNNVLAAGLSDNNNISEGRNLSAYQAVMNVSENDLEELLENDSISLVENDHLVYMSSLDTSLDVSLDASLDTELETSETDISVMIGNYYPDSFDPIDIESYHEDDIFGSNVKIAIMDTGLNPKSTELNLYGGATFVDESNSFADDNGHGTAMAGIIGAAMDNQGLTGIAPMAELYSVKVLNSDGIGYVSSVIEGIHWAVENDMDIICFGFTSKEYSSALETAVEYAHENGIIMIAPAGNYGSDDVCYPAGYDEVVSVGSTDYSGNVSEFSNYGSYVDVYAPGEDIDSILYINNKPTPFTGTSAAAAHVAGIAALIINQSNNSALTQNSSVFSINKLENIGFSVNNDVLLESVDTSPNNQSVLSTAESLTAKSYADTEEISARNTVIASTSIGINTLVKGTIDSSKQKRYYHFNLTSAYQDVVFVLNSPEGYDYRIFLEDYYSNTAIDVTNNTLSLAAGRYSFYVCGEQDDDYNSELEYSLILLLTATKSYTVEREFSDGVNETTGNFGYTFDDLTTTIGGKEFKIQRYYNSSDLTETHFNAGWRFNFECYAYHPNSYEYDPEEDKETLEGPDENVIALIIPDGSILKFQRRSKNENNTEWDYVPLDSRAEIDCSRFDWSLDLVVTMPDETKYYYYPMIDPEIEGLEYDSFGCLYKIVDKYGNETEINLDHGKITDIVDYAGNNYNFEYNEQGKLVSISDDFGREVTYEYDGDELIKSTDSAGNSYSYSYSSLGGMSELRNSAGGLVYEITYELDLYVPDLLVVKDLTDENGTTYRYGYDTNNNTTTVTEIVEDETTSGKITSSTYDIERQITYRKNEKNETVLMEYYYQQSGTFGINSNDEITFIVDKDYHKWPNGQLISYTNEAGVVTKNEFDIFEQIYGAGLPISTTVSDASGTVYEYVSYEYDRNDNLVLVKNWLEKPETGTGKYKATRYIYDEDGVYLLKKAEYLPILSSNQSVPELTSNNADDFAITSYEYDENHSIKGLVKKSCTRSSIQELKRIKVGYTNMTATEIVFQLPTLKALPITK